MRVTKIGIVKVLILVVAMLLGGLATVSQTGCAHKQVHVTSLPAGVSEQEAKDWLTAAGAVAEIAKLTKAAAQSELGLRAVTYDGKSIIPDDKHQEILEYIGRIAQGGLHLDNVLQGAPQRFGTGTKIQIQGLIDDLLAESEKVNAEGLSGMNNAQADQLNQSLKALDGTIKILVALVSVK